ncbi:MAG: hypothetical protein UR47_C0011G0001, partial [candidate division WS6 bacterium GW2011_GWB1_33_6]
MNDVQNFNINNEITVKSLFDKLDTYLIRDIETMLDAKHKDSSGIGYPCLITILSGMELLGILISGDEDHAFKYFWERLEEENDIYKSSKLRHIFRQTIRNGIAHYYIAKTGIYVHNDNPENHLNKVTIQGINGIYVSCSALYNDFKVVYEKVKADLLKDPSNFLIADKTLGTINAIPSMPAAKIVPKIIFWIFFRLSFFFISCSK